MPQPGSFGRLQKVSGGKLGPTSQSSRQCGIRRFWVTLSILCRIAAYLIVSYFMSPVAIFRICSIGSLVFALLTVGVDFIPGMAPGSQLLAVEETLAPGKLLFVAIFSSVVGIAGVVATVGLVLFAPWSRALALVSTAASIAVYPFSPPLVQSGLASMLFYLCAFSWGVAVSMAYFSPLSVRFAKGS